MQQQLTGPISQDTDPLYQPQGSARFILNGVLNTRHGSKRTIATEEGNNLCIDFTTEGYLGYSLIGTHRLSDNSVVLFLTDDTHSVIGLQKNCKFQLLVNADCLNFQTTKRISALSKVFDGCGTVLYFTDSYNAYRSINIDNLEQYLLPGETISSANISGAGWDCGLFKHFYDYDFPSINLVKVNDAGGSLRLGVFTFSARYIDNDGNATNWIPFTSEIPITNGVVGTNSDLTQFDLLQGGENDDTGSTGKSITLQATNLDSRFAFVQFAVIEYTEGIQTPINYYILEQVAISGTSVNYTYSGFNRNIHSAATLDELTIPTVTIDTVHTHAQVGGRLFFANVKEYSRDWSKFQREALKIKSSWVSTAIDNFSQIYTTPATRRAYYYFDNKSYMRDEIYAFGIVYVFKDGSMSPVFHIPGTAADTTERLAALATFQANPHNRQNGGTLVDRQLLTVVTTPASQTALEVAEADVRHLGLSNGDTVERWKVFNTAILQSYTTPYANGGTYSHNVASGMMAFWECETSVYPEDVDCNGDYIYAEDAWGNTLAGTPIRHHKFPDATLIEHAFCSRILTNSPANPTYDSIEEIVHSRLGVSFTNVNIPTDYVAEVQGYYIVRVKRDEFNSTVIDKGLFNNTEVGVLPAGTETVLYNPAHNDGFIAGTGLSQDNGKQGCLLSSKSLQGTWDGSDWLRTPAEGSHLKFECVWYAYNVPGGQQESYFSDIEKPALNHTNRQIVDSILVASNRRGVGSGFQHALYNNNWMNDVNFISYTDATTHLTVGTVAPIFRRAWYVSVKKHVPDLMGSLYQLSYIKTHTNMLPAASTATGTVFGGDVFINNYSWAGYSALGTDDPVPTDIVTPINDNRFGCIVINLFEETVNLGLRHYGLETYERQPEPNYLGANKWFNIPINYATAEMLDPDTDAVKRQWKALNPDYSVNSKISVFYPLSINHNWCDNCNGRQPNFIYYSDKSSAFDVADNYRVVRALNVDKLFPEDGPITALFVDKDRLFATTPNSVIFLATRPQTLQGDGTTIYTGTADVFSAPPKKLVSSDIGYAGVEDKFSINVNEFGTILVDTMRGKVFLMREGLEEISNRGLQMWLRDNLSFNLKRFVSELDPVKLYTHVNGVGLQSVYDPKYRRLIIHKRDYIPAAGITFGGLLPVSPAANTLYYAIAENGFIYWEYNGTPVEVSNSTLFENKSWTLSYSFEEQGWVSWHSYMPDFMYNNSDTFFSFAHDLNNEGIWQHNAENYTTYYNQKYDYILEIVASPSALPGVYADVEVNCYADSPTAFTEGYPEKKFFDRLWVYSPLQSSGVNDIVETSATNMGQTVYGNSYASQTVFVRNIENRWRFNVPRDLVDPAYTSVTNSYNWLNIKTEFNQQNGYQGYIDRVPTTVSTNKLFKSVSRFRSSYVLMRFFFKPETGIRLVNELMNIIKYPSIR
jgi:hypothetical protein